MISTRIFCCIASSSELVPSLGDSSEILVLENPLGEFLMKSLATLSPSYTKQHLRQK